MQCPVFYDCEASGLEGFPIEIGWAFFDAGTGTVESESHLVNPSPEWDVQSLWDPDAEALHGISLKHLRQHGQPAYSIARRMNQCLADRELFSDSPMDEAWLKQLFDAAGLEPFFIIRRTLAGVITEQAARSRLMPADVYRAAQERATQLSPRTHRAEADARHLATFWQLITEGSF
jgi:DNA polymerase III epsilon subunit-like protein